MTTLIWKCEAIIMKKENFYDDEKGANGLWDKAGDIATQVGLYLQKNPVSTDGIVYGEDYGQEVIYEMLKDLVKEYTLLNSFLDNHCDVYGVKETVKALYELGADKETLLSMKFDKDAVEETVGNCGGNVVKVEHDDRGNMTYIEYDNGNWNKFKYDDLGNLIYCEYSNGYWAKQDYDDHSRETYYETSDGYWERREYDDRGNCIYYEDSDGYWCKFEYDDNGNCTYYENSTGYKKGTPRAELEHEPDITNN